MSLSLVILASIRNPDAAVLRNFLAVSQNVSGGVAGLDLGHMLSGGGVLRQDFGVGSSSSGVAGQDFEVGSSSSGLSGQDFGVGPSSGGLSGQDFGVGSSSSGLSGQDFGVGPSSGGLSGQDFGVGPSSGGLSGQDFGVGPSSGGHSGQDFGVGSSSGEFKNGSSRLGDLSSALAMPLPTDLAALFRPQPGGCPPIASKRQVGCIPNPHLCIREAKRYGCDPLHCHGKRCTPINWLPPSKPLCTGGKRCSVIPDSLSRLQSSFVNQPSSVMSAFG